ncbi:MAG: hypothetical protein IPP43_02985 [Chitinophagaceae bacterium]|nr:hypothetical protein [Chitinophagaceae bacterium]
MKKILSLLTIILLAAVSSYSQAPGIFNYQGVARNSVGNVLANKSISLRLTIHDGTAAGPTVYQESRTVITNPFGLFNVQVGSPGATGVTGNIPGVAWGVGAKYIQVEIDPNGGAAFINIGTAQLASVPYSLYANLAADLVLPFNKTQADAGTLFKITNSNTTSAGATSLEGLTNSTANGVAAIIGTVTSVAPGGFSAGVRGINNGTAGLGIGVYGSQNGSGWGVYGTTPSGIGVNGGSTSGIGVNGLSTSGIGVLGTSTSGVGVSGTSSTSNAGSFLNTNAANNAPTVSISQASTNNTALAVSGPGIWGSAIGITNTTSGMEWRTSVNGTTYTVTKIPGSTFSPVQLFSTGGLDFSSSASTSIMRLLDNTNVGITNTAPTYRLDVDASTGGSNGLRVRNTSSFATVDVVGAGLDQAVRFGKNGVINSGINTLPDGDHINFFKFGAGDKMALNVNTGNFGVGGTAINAVAKVHVRGYNTTNNLYSSSTGFLGATGIGSNDITAQAANEKWGIHSFVNGGVSVQHAIFVEPGTTGIVNTGLFGRVSTAPAGGTSHALYAFDAVNNGTTTWAATIAGRMNYSDGTQGLNKILKSDAVGNASWSTLAGLGLVSGTGFTNRVAFWNSASSISSNPNFWWDDANSRLGIGTTTPAYPLDVVHGGATGAHIASTGSFSVVDIDANSGDAALRFQKSGVGRWNTRNRPADDYYEIFELGGGGSRFVIQDATGWVGIGGPGATTAPAYQLDVEHGGATGIRSKSSASFSVVDIDANSGDAALRFQKAGVGQWNTRNRPADDYYEIFELGGGGSRLVIQDGTGNVGIGQTVAPAYKLDVLHGGSTGIRVQSSGSFSVIDIDAASGDAALRFANAGVNQWNIRNRPADDYLEIFELGGGGSRMVIQDATGNVGIGQTVAPAYKLDVLHGGATGLRVQSSATFSIVDIDGANGDAALRFAKAGVNQWNTRNNPATDDYQIFELGGGGERFQIQDATGNVGIGGISPAYRLDVQHGGATGVHVVSTATFSVVDIDGANGDAALRFQKAGVNQWNTRNNPATDDYQIFEFGGGGERLRIDNTTGDVNIAQNLNVAGTLTKGAGAFKIDHPLDPANKYLVHSFVESPDMMNIYNGNIVTDANGKATVQLPDYFEALNMEFRYQLTVIGAFEQAIVNKEVSNNQFEIATSKPNVKVSWQVTGIRHDAYAEKNRIPNTVEKEAKNKGKYLSPESFNMPKTAKIGYSPEPEVSSLNDVKPAAKKTVDPASLSGGSLNYTAPKTTTNKAVDNSGSVANTEPAKAVVKPVDNSGSVADVEATKPATKKVDNSGSVSDQEIQKPVIKTQEVKADKTIEPVKAVKEELPAILKGTSMDPNARPIVPASKTPDVVAPAQNSGNTQPAAEQKQVSKENNSVLSSANPVKKN